MANQPVEKDRNIGNRNDQMPSGQGQGFNKDQNLGQDKGISGTDQQQDQRRSDINKPDVTGQDKGLGRTDDDVMNKDDEGLEKKSA
jgi:hypothetical protein